MSTLAEIGHVEAIFGYSVKSMVGERLEAAKLGWYGLDGDRRLASRRTDDRSCSSRIVTLMAGLSSPSPNESTPDKTYSCVRRPRKGNLGDRLYLMLDAATHSPRSR